MNILLLSCLLALSSCLPDSFTKYREDPPQKSVKTTSSPGTTPSEETQDDSPEATYNFYFPYRRNSRLWLDVESTEGFFKGNALLLCWSEVFLTCSSNPNGRATIYHVDAHRRRIYVLTDPTGLDLDYRQGMYVWRAEGYAKTPLLKEPMRLYNTTDSMAIQGELTNEFNENITTLNLGTGSLPFFYTSSPPLPRGITLSTQNALIQTPTTPFILQEQIDGEYRVKATDPNDNTHLAARTFRISIVDPPSSFSYSLPNPIRLNRGEDRLDNRVIVYPPLQEGADELYFELDPSSDPLPAGISFNEKSGLIEGIPTSYTPLANLTVQLYHPISSLNFVLSTDVNIITATNITSLYVHQNPGRTLLLKVNNIDDFVEGEKVSNQRGAVGTISYIDPHSKDLFVRVDATYDGPEIFSTGDNLDSRSTYYTSRAVVQDLYHIVESDGSGSNNLAPTANPIRTTVYTDTNNTNPFNSQGNEILTFSILPALNRDLNFCTTDSTDNLNNAQPLCAGLGGSIIDTDGRPGQAPLSQTLYTVFATNSIGKTIQTQFKLVIIQPPRDLSLARLQYIPITPIDPSSNTYVRRRLFEGSIISTQKAGGAQGTQGKVIDLSTNSDGHIDGILVKANDHIELNEEIDNEAVFYSSAARAQEFAYLYVTDVSAFSPGETISNSHGSEATIIPNGVSQSDNRIVVKLENESTFSPGDAIDDQTSFRRGEAIITTMTKQAYVNLVATFSDSSLFQVGESISTNSTPPARGWVVFNDTNNNKVYIRHLNGKFRDGDVVRDSDGGSQTILNLKSNYIGIETNVASTHSTLSSFQEGNNLVSYQQGVANSHRGSGSLIDVSPDSSNTHLLVQWESGIFDLNFDLTADNFILSGAGNAQDGLDPTVVYHENAYYLYSGVPANFQIYYNGTATSLTIEPALPDGLVFDDQTETITGTPTTTSPKQTYTLTIRNKDQVSQYSFQLQVLNQFYVYYTTTNENASTYIMHKTGQGFRTSDCRIVGNQVTDENGDDRPDQRERVNDIVCILDAGENDLFLYGVDLKVRISPGFCENLVYSPYGYSSFPPLQTDPSTHYVTYERNEGAEISFANCNTWSYTGFDGTTPVPADQLSSFLANPTATPPPWPNRLWGSTYCTEGDCAADNTPDEPRCIGNHSINDNDKPNCDEGSYTIDSYSCTIPETPGECSCTKSTNTFECNGEQVACRNGPVNKTPEVPERDVGVTSRFNHSIAAFNGLDNQNFSLTAPHNLRDSLLFNKQSTAYLANWTHRAPHSVNSCLVDDAYNFNVNAWESYHLTSLNLALDPNFGFANSSYSFSCTDGASNTKARIRVYIREWDTNFSPNDPIDKLDNTSPKQDDTANSCFGNVSCNDYFDLDDLFQIAQINYRPNFTSCGIPRFPTGNAITAGTVDADRGEYIGRCIGFNCWDYLYPGVLVQIQGQTYLINNVSSNTFTVTTPFGQNHRGEQITSLLNFPFLRH